MKIIVLASIILLSVPLAASAATYGDYTYTVTNSEATVTDFNSAYAGPLSITNELGGYPVTAIGDRGFSTCTSLTSVTIPDSVTSIGDYAFRDCSSLERLYFTGNAPTPGTDVFQDSDNATVYYLPGATGWGATYAGRPAVLWNPAFTAAGLSDGAISCTITGTTDIPIAVEACTNLLTGPWCCLCITNLNAGCFDFHDPDATNHPVRFYRVVGP